MGAAGRVLIVDDEPDVRDFLCAALSVSGWEPVAVGDGTAAMERIRAGGIAAVVLDVNLGAVSGYQVCREIRSISTVPILFLTARTDEFDHLLGLELGADDYLTKPVSPAMLGARLAAVLRRAATDADAAGPLRARSIALDPRSRRVTVSGTPLELSRTEYELLELFLAEPDRAFTREALLDRIWGDWHSDDHVIDVTMGRLRRKLDAVGEDGLIETVRGVGYRLARG